jgi:hypothetical protein
LERRGGGHTRRTGGHRVRAASAVPSTIVLTRRTAARVPVAGAHKGPDRRAARDRGRWSAALPATGSPRGAAVPADPVQPDADGPPRARHHPAHLIHRSSTEAIGRWPHHMLDTSARHAGHRLTARMRSHFTSAHLPAAAPRDRRAGGAGRRDAAPSKPVLRVPPSASPTGGHGAPEVMAAIRHSGMFAAGRRQFARSPPSPRPAGRHFKTPARST